MEWKSKILELLGQPDYTPIKATELAAKLQLKSGSGKDLETALHDLMATGEVVEIKNNKLCLPADADLIVGRISFRQSGKAILIPEAGGDAITISAEDTGVALHGDKVLVRKISPGNVRRYKMGPRGKAMPGDTEVQGRVIRILRRARTVITGTLARSKLQYHVIPDDPRIVHNILVADPKTSRVVPTPKADDKVVVALEEWKQKHLNPEGRITAVLGKSHEPRTEHAALFVSYGLEPEFSKEVEAEAKAVGVPVTAAQTAGRLDLRGKNVFTIDPDDAKDFDDALHVETMPNGRIKIGIHIADVSAYVRPNKPLDHEAQRRGNSTYLVGEVVPMLPHVLSSGVCSLKEAEDRLTKSVIVTFDAQGNTEHVEFANTVIRSIKRLTYKQAKVFLDEPDYEKIRAMPPPPSHQTGFAGRPLKSLSNDEMRVLQTSIRQMWSIASRLRAARMAQGSLDLDMPEAKIYIDAQGYPDRIERVEHDESHQLVEEFMLTANKEVARAFNRQNFPCIHRVHDKPDTEKLDELSATLQQLGIKVGDMNNSREVSKFLTMTRDHPKGVYLRSLFLRSLKQAQYRASPDGHFGLAMSDYTHFTSPIRRYADLIVHRIFDGYLYRNALPTAPRELIAHYNVGVLQAIADHISGTEQNSTEAERQSVKNRLLEYYELESEKSPKNKFEAVITDVKNHGLFIELTQSMAYGFVHVSSLTSDFYMLSEDEQALVGRRSQTRYAIGEKILVTVERVDRFKRQIDFHIARQDGVTMPPMRTDGGANRDTRSGRTDGRPNSRRSGTNSRSRTGGRSGASTTRGASGRGPRPASSGGRPPSRPKARQPREGGARPSQKRRRG